MKDIIIDGDGYFEIPKPYTIEELKKAEEELDNKN